MKTCCWCSGVSARPLDVDGEHYHARCLREWRALARTLRARAGHSTQLHDSLEVVPPQIHSSVGVLP
jgi:hypothetical protein